MPWPPRSRSASPFPSTSPHRTTPPNSSRSSSPAPAPRTARCSIPRCRSTSSPARTCVAPARSARSSARRCRTCCPPSTSRASRTPAAPTTCAPAQLRGLSPDQVLVLVNGKRRHTSAIVNLEAKIGKGTDAGRLQLDPARRDRAHRSAARRRRRAVRLGRGRRRDQHHPRRCAERRRGGLHLRRAPHRLRAQRRDADRRPDPQLRRRGRHPAGRTGFLRLGVDYTDRAQTERGGPDGIPFFEEQTPANLALAGSRNYRPGDPASDQTTTAGSTASCRSAICSISTASRPTTTANPKVRRSSATRIPARTSATCIRTAIAR